MKDQVKILKSSKSIDNVIKDSKTVASGDRVGNLYELNFSPVNNVEANLVVNESKLWHARLGHVNYDSLKHLSKDGHLKVAFKDDFCETCTVGKQRRASHPSTAQLHSEGLFQEEEPQRNPPSDKNTQRQPEPMNIGEMKITCNMNSCKSATRRPRLNNNSYLRRQRLVKTRRINSKIKALTNRLRYKSSYSRTKSCHFGCSPQLGQPLTNEPPNAVNVAPAQQLLEGVRDIVSQAFRE
ncbi:hypothetical protein U1Q18_046283 [Sarracenia purpurea var. burkii]